MNFTKLMYSLGFVSLVLAPFTGITIFGAAGFFIIGYISEKRRAQQEEGGIKELHIENELIQNTQPGENKPKTPDTSEKNLGNSNKISAGSFISEDQIRMRRATKKILDQTIEKSEEIYNLVTVNGEIKSNEVDLFLLAAQSSHLSDDKYEEYEIRLFVSTYYKIFGHKSTLSKFPDGNSWYVDRVESLQSDEEYFFLFFLLLGRIEGVVDIVGDYSDISEDTLETSVRQLMKSMGLALEKIRTNGNEMELAFSKEVCLQSYEILIEKFRSKGFYRCASLLTG